LGFFEVAKNHDESQEDEDFNQEIRRWTKINDLLPEI
jgi:hypothetical protein